MDTHSDTKVTEQLWKKAVNPGRPKIFPTAYDLWIAMQGYFKWCDENPWYKDEAKVVDKEIVHEQTPYARPYTMGGLQIFLGVGHDFFRQYKSGQKEDPNGEYSGVITIAEEICRTQKFEGAAAGFFNANIISRDLGLADKKQVEANFNLTDKPIEFD